MYMNTDMYIYTYIYMYIFMCVLWCRVMSCVARRCWLGGVVWCGVAWCGVVWCGDVVVSNCVLVVLSSCGELSRHAAFSSRSSCWSRVLVLLSPFRRVVVFVCGGVSESTVFQRVAHQTHSTDTTCTRAHTTQHITHNITHNTTQHHTQHHTETQTGREREEKMKGERQDKTKEDKTTRKRREKTDDSFSMCWCMAVLS